MSEPFIGEIRIWACNFAPRGWLPCTGGVLPIAQNQALFSVIGTAYGGDGRNTFGLPNLTGSVPVHWETGPGLSRRVLGQIGGHEGVSLTPSTMPSHNHTLNAQQGEGTSNAPQNAFLAQDMVSVGPRTRPSPLYAPAESLQPMSALAITQAGEGVAHENRQPFLTLNFCIATEGIYPARS